MKLLSIAIASALVGLCGGPDGAAYNARVRMKEASAIHSSGKHAESVAKYEEAARAVNVNLDRQK